MRADFVNEVARILDIKRKDLIEKDLILHQIFLDLSGDRFFTVNLLFKGGTCLIKSYFGYLRFSEDIDFTWKDQGVFEVLRKLPKKEGWILNVKKAMPIISSSAGATKHAHSKSGTWLKY